MLQTASTLKRHLNYLNDSFNNHKGGNLKDKINLLFEDILESSGKSSPSVGV